MNADTSQVLWLAAAMIAIASGSILSRRHTKNGYTFYCSNCMRSFLVGKSRFKKALKTHKCMKCGCGAFIDLENGDLKEWHTKDYPLSTDTPKIYNGTKWI